MESSSGTEEITRRGAAWERSRGPPQAAWRESVEHPSGGPSAPGRRCWRLGRKRPSPFSNSGPTPLRPTATLRPEFGGPKSLRCCAKGVGHRAQLMLRARSGRQREHRWPLYVFLARPVLSNILFPYSFRILVPNRVYILEYAKDTAPNRAYILKYSLYSRWKISQNR